MADGVLSEQRDTRSSDADNRLVHAVNTLVVQMSCKHPEASDTTNFVRMATMQC
jgi:hypothetical protein